MKASVSAMTWSAVAAGLAITFASCGSGGTSLPAGPSEAGKAVVREQAVDGSGSGIPGATVLVDSEPTEIITDEEGFFTVTLDPGQHLLEARVEGVTVWSAEVLVEEEPEGEPPGGDPGEGETETALDGDSPGIGRCVSECTHIYNPAKRDPLADDLFEGRFNARYCVEFCKENSYPGGYSPGEDGQCNPFYQGSDPDCGGGPPDGEESPEVVEDGSGVTAEATEKEGAPGNGRGRHDRS